MATKIRDKTSRPTRIIINLKNYGHNIEIAKKLSKSDIILVVKANAYGHGAKELTTYAYNKHNIKNFAVATLEEALELRDVIGDKAEIIVLGYIEPYLVQEACKRKITLTVYNEEIARMYNDQLDEDSLLKIVLKIDTGMNRLGFKQIFDLSNFLRKYNKFHIFAIMSHLSSADSDREYTNYQISTFDNFIKHVEVPCNTTLFNSAGICNYENSYTFTRPGIMTYGYVNTETYIDLKKVMYLYTNIIHINKVKKGDRIGYNGTFIASEDMVVGVLPIGYGDGFRRNLSNIGYVYINGIKCNIIGNICMDMTMIDITALPENYLGSNIEIIGEHIGADILANMCNTIPYEILTNFSLRIKKQYEGFR
jgi:alanine racemase